MSEVSNQKRTSFQSGSLVKRETAKGHRWVLRYTKDGVRKAKVIGDHITLATEAEARRKAADMVPTINDDTPVYTFGQLVERYRADEMPARMDTQASYRSNLKHLEARWSKVPVTEMLKDLMAIQTWVSGLKKKTGEPLSKKSKQHVKGLLHRIVECAMKWGYLPVDRNPISLVEIKVSGIQPKKRKKVPITIEAYKKLIADPELCAHVKVMIVLAMCLGLRISEILGLRWEDMAFEDGTISIERSSVGKFIDATKSDESEALLPLHSYVAQVLKIWSTLQTPINGWVFGSVVTGRPFHRDSLQSDHLLPAGLRAGISGLGWHTFRHTHVDILRELKISPEVQTLSMRHSDPRTTAEYGRDGGSVKLVRPANDALVQAIVGSKVAK